MPKLKAVVDPQKCQPLVCGEGTCIAIASCSLKVLRQDSLWELPQTDLDMCRGCLKCLRACPSRAIVKIWG